MTPGLGQGKYKVSLEHHLVLENKKMFEYILSMDMSKRYQSEKGFHWDNLNIKLYNGINRL